MNTRDEIIEALKGNRGDTAPPAIFTQTGTVSQMDNCGQLCLCGFAVCGLLLLDLL